MSDQSVCHSFKASGVNSALIFFFVQHAFKRLDKETRKKGRIMSRWCEDASNVAVVGNGPLRDEDRSDIETKSCVIRLNDAKNKRESERTDVAVIRSHVISKGKVDKYKARRVYDLYDDDVLLVPFMESNLELHDDLGRHIFADPVPIHTTGKKKLHFTGHIKLFPKCETSPLSNTSSNGPSTGGALLHYLESDNGVDTIDVYGMNWTGGNWHVDFKNPNLVRDCCTKCHIHQTPSNEYLPPMPPRPSKKSIFDRFKFDGLF